MKNPMNQKQTAKTEKTTRHQGFKAILLTVGCLSLIGAGSGMIYAASPVNAYTPKQPITIQAIRSMSEGDSAVNESKVVNKTMTTVAGKTFNIKLEQNDSTGYSWTYKADPQLTLVKAWEQTTKSQDEGDDPIVGAPTNKTWTFKTTKPGTYTVTFKYERAWEKGVKPAETVVYTIHVK